jgi:hypothetical protein
MPDMPLHLAGARLPTAVLATGLVLLAFLSQVCGPVPDGIARGRKHSMRLTSPALRAAGT